MALSNKNRLRAKKDFDNIFKNGKTARSRFLLVKTIETDHPLQRIGFIIPVKTVKKAVIRNRVKRILSNTVQQNLDKIEGDMIVLLLKLPVDRKKEKEILSEELKILITKRNE